MTRIGPSDLDVFPLSLGGNVFGWTADRDASFAILDAFHDGGGNFIDTADAYSAWVPGHTGGESEQLIGQWLASRTPRDMVVATKVSRHPEFPGLTPANVRAGAEASLRRLGVESIDLYYAHYDDPAVPMDDIVSGFDALVTDGLVRHVAVSNMSPERIRAWIDVATARGQATPVAIQPHYNLVHRAETEAQVLPLAEEYGLGVVPYYGLAAGFLTGKYRSSDPTAHETPRARGAAAAATEQGLAVVDALAGIGERHGASIAATALAWLRARPTVVAPIASASRVSQVADLLDSARIDLTAAEVDELDRISAPEA